MLGWICQLVLPWVKVLLQQLRLLRDIITLLYLAHRVWLLISDVEWGWGAGYHDRQPQALLQILTNKPVSTEAFFWCSFHQDFFAWFLFIRPGLLGRGNDSSKTPSEESDIVSKSHRLTPGYYWIRLCSLVAPLLPAWGSSRESEAKVTIQPNKVTSLKEHHDIGNSHLLSGSKTNLGTKNDLYWKEKDVWLVMWPSNEPLEYDKIEGKALENIDTKTLKYGH